MYPGTIFNLKKVDPNSRVYYVIDIDYDGDPYDKSLLMFEIGPKEKKEKIGVISTISVVGYCCEDIFWCHRFKPNDCFYSNNSFSSTEIWVRMDTDCIFKI